MTTPNHSDSVKPSSLLTNLKQLMLKTTVGRAARELVRAVRKSAQPLNVPLAQTIDRDYAQWLLQNPDDQPREVQTSPTDPLFTLILTIQDASTTHLTELLNSVGSQVYAKWQLCVIDDGSECAETIAIVERFADRFPSQVICRRTAPQTGFAAAGNAALALADGEFVAWIDQDAVLSVNALSAFADAIRRKPEVDILYCDHDSLTSDGTRTAPNLKPAWSPELFTCSNYIGRVIVFRRESITRVGKLRAEFEGCEIDDLIFRMSERTNRICHVPGLLYHTRDKSKSVGDPDESSPRAIQSRLKAVQGHVNRTGNTAVVTRAESSTFKLEFVFDSYPRVTIVIPTKDRVDLLKTCLSSLDQKTTYSNYDVIVVDNGSRELATFEYYETCPHQIVSRSLKGRFNFSALVNAGVRAAEGDFVLLLNNDTEIIQPTWLHELVGYGRIKGVGAVGAKLLYPDRRIQHAGVVMGHEGLTGHYFQGETDDPGDAGYLGLKNKVRNVAAVTGACLLTPRAVYEALGGFNEEDLAVAWNDVEYCLRLLKKGLRIVFNPRSVLLHHEGASRGEAKNAKEVQYMMEHWSEIIRDDPYYHSYFSRTGNSFRLRLDPQESTRYFYHQHPKSFEHSDDAAEVGVTAQK